MSTNQTVEIDCGLNTEASSENVDCFKDNKNKSHESNDETLKTANILVIGRPKRPLSAYNLFFQEERRRLISSRAMAASNNSRQGKSGSSKGRIGFAEMAKTIAAKWHTIDPESKSRYDAIAKQEKARHRRTIAEWKKINKENNNAGLTISSKKRRQADSLMGDIERVEKFASNKKKTSPTAPKKATARVLESCGQEEAAPSSSNAANDQNEKPAAVESSPVAKPEPSPEVEPCAIETEEPAIEPSPVETLTSSFATVAVEKAAPTFVEGQQSNPPVTVVAPPAINQDGPTQFEAPVPVATFEQGDDPSNELQRFAAYWGMAPMSAPAWALATGTYAQQSRTVIGLDRLVQDLRELQSLDLFVDIFATNATATATGGNY